MHAQYLFYPWFVGECLLLFHVQQLYHLSSRQTDCCVARKLASNTVTIWNCSWNALYFPPKWLFPVLRLVLFFGKVKCCLGYWRHLYSYILNTPFITLSLRFLGVTLMNVLTPFTLLLRYYCQLATCFRVVKVTWVYELSHKNSNYYASEVEKSH
jgi:hypothetical protein